MKLCKGDIVFGEDEGNELKHRVIFVKESNENILALFPDIIQATDEIMGYQHDGGSNTCHVDLCFNNELAEPMEYEDLLYELKVVFEPAKLDVLNKNYT